MEATNPNYQSMPEQKEIEATNYPNSPKKDPFEEMMNNIDEQLGLREKERPPKKTIFQVPSRLRKSREDNYSPRVVSIGPMHHGNSSLQPMEELKWIYVNSFFRRAEDPEEAFEKCGKEIVDVEEEARKYYARNFKMQNKYQLAQILLVDGCFILELLLRNSKYKEGVIEIKEDPILNNDLRTRMLQQDLALLENQIPFIVLETLLRCVDSNIPSSCITQYALKFFSPILNFRSEEFHIDMGGANLTNLHLLQIMHNYLLPPHNKTNMSVSVEKKSWGFKRGATKLYEGGLKFRSTSGKHLLDIDFDDENGVICIPELRIGGIMSTLVRNLIAYEQRNFETKHHMTAYIMLMGSLVSSSEDAEFLKKEKILEVELGSSEDVLSYFKNICVELDPKDYYFDGLCQRVNDYWKSHWNCRRRRAATKVWCQETMATMKRDYCPNPFKTMSVIAAFVLLLLTALQTIYSVLSYYPH